MRDGLMFGTFCLPALERVIVHAMKWRKDDETDGSSHGGTWDLGVDVQSLLSVEVMAVTCLSYLSTFNSHEIRKPSDTISVVKGHRKTDWFSIFVLVVRHVRGG